ncbi:CAP domain-containing protein [Metabacillus sp. RGM 3146]|uniref:CAP domain-containing protein n=1 Tax=Metabacillus sp. RGM 3146 TaxID=3401092 RepID=UPI003B9B2B41
MKKIAHLSMAMAAFILVMTHHSSAEASSLAKSASREGQTLQSLSYEFSKQVKAGNVYSINSEYDSLSSQILRTEAAIGKVSGKASREKMNQTYIKPAKILKERVIYEVSEYRLMYDAGRDILSDKGSRVKAKTAKLDRLSKRAAQIKEAGHYTPLPSIVNRYLNGMAGMLKKGTFIEKTPGRGKVNSFEYDVFLLTNMERQKQSLPQLTLKVNLASIAKEKSRDMYRNGYFDHQSPTYGSPFQMMQRYHISYQYAGENIAMGYCTPQDAVSGWMHSEDHRENILRKTFTKIGTGYDQYYWTQMFTG